MRSITHYIKITIAFLLLSATFTACNKDDLTGQKAMQLVVTGYNGTADELEVAIDTTRYDKTVSYGKFIFKPLSIFDFGAVYTYPTAKKPGLLSIKNSVTGKILFSKSLPENGTKAIFNFIYINEKILDIPLPAVDATTNKLGFYLHYNENNDPVDVFLYRKDQSTGTEYREYLAKKVLPKSWISVDYIASVNFDDKNELRAASIYITKAGTLDQWAFQDMESMSKVSVFGMGLPLAGEKGLVQSYFIAAGANELERSRLFFHPDRPW
jgi:hypothetical protein